jgi:hypothetical protein
MWQETMKTGYEFPVKHESMKGHLPFAICHLVFVIYPLP